MNNLIEFKPRMLERLSQRVVQLWRDSGPLVTRSDYTEAETQTLRLVGHLSPQDRVALGHYIKKTIKTTKVAVSPRLYGVLKNER